VSRTSTARSPLLGPIVRRFPVLTVHLVLLAGRALRRRVAAEALALRVVEETRRTASPQRARRAVAPLVSRPPQRADVAADVAALLVGLGDPAAAVEVCRAVLDRASAPEARARLNAQLGRARIRDGDPSGGAAALAAALRADVPQRPIWRLWAAQALANAGRPGEVEDVLDARAVAALEPGQQARAVKVLVASGAWERVHEVLAAGLVAPEAAARAAKLAARAGRGDDAVAMARTITDPTWRGKALLDVARTHLAAEEHDRAVDVADEAVRADHRSVDALTVLVRTLQHAGRLAEARAVVQRAADQNPGDAALLAWAVAASYRLRSWDEAAALVERLRPLDGAAARVAAARIAVRAGDLDAPAQVERLEVERPDDPEVARVVAELAQRSARVADAYDAYRVAATGLPDDADVRLACARLAIQLQRDEEALDHLDWLLEQRPKDPRLRRMQVRAEARLGRRTALDDLAEVGADPTDDELVFELVSGLVDGGRDDDAATALERALLDRARASSPRAEASA
jgi:tetratricopeptide (TPR) repeat protein